MNNDFDNFEFDKKDYVRMPTLKKDESGRVVVEEIQVKYTDGTCSREIEECDPIAPARGILNGLILSIPAWLAVVFIYKLCVLVYWIGVESYWRSFS